MNKTINKIRRFFNIIKDLNNIEKCVKDLGIRHDILKDTALEKYQNLEREIYFLKKSIILNIPPNTNKEEEKLLLIAVDRGYTNQKNMVYNKIKNKYYKPYKLDNSSNYFYSDGKLYLPFKYKDELYLIPVFDNGEWLEIMSLEEYELLKRYEEDFNRHLQILEKMGFTSLEHYQEEFDDKLYLPFPSTWFRSLRENMLAKFDYNEKKFKYYLITSIKLDGNNRVPKLEEIEI